MGGSSARTKLPAVNCRVSWRIQINVIRYLFEINLNPSTVISFVALPSQQGPVQGRFKPVHLPISLSTKVAACVRRFETPTALNHGRTESKKDISMLTIPFLSCITLKRSVGVMC